MKRRHIIIIDKDRNNQQVLRNNFVQANFEVDLANNDTEALKLIKAKRYDAMITELTSPGIDGYGLLDTVKGMSKNARTPIIFLTVKNDVWNRVKSLQNGAQDYIIKPIHVKELVARVRMLLNRIERKTEEERIFKRKFSGKLEDISVFDLIKVFGLEKKTGILSLYRENGHTGQIFFEKGNLINASTYLLNAELAVYKMMTWRNGFFSMHFCDIDVLDEINISNLAILLQGAMRMEMSDDLQKKLPPRTAVVSTTPNFKKITAKQELKSELQQFLELFDGQRTLEDIIQESKSDELETLQRILKLFDMGFLQVIEPDEKPKEPVVAEPEKPKSGGSNPLIDELLDNHDNGNHHTPKPAPVTSDTNFTPIASSAPKITVKEKSIPSPQIIEPEVETVVEYAERPVEHSKEKPKAANPLRDVYSKAKGTVLIISKDITQGKPIVDNLAAVQPIMKSAGSDGISDMYVGTAQFKHNLYLNLTSISTEKEFDPLLEYFSSKTLGYVLLVDTRRANWNYYFYLLNVLRRRLSVPSVIVVSNQGNAENSITIDEIRSRLSLQENEKIMFCSDYDKVNSKKIIFSLFKNYYKKS